MEITEIIGVGLFAFAIVLAAWKVGFAFGYDAGRVKGYATADRRVKGVLDSENARRPRKRARLVYRKVDARTVGKKRYLNSRLPGEVVA